MGWVTKVKPGERLIVNGISLTFSSRTSVDVENVDDADLAKFDANGRLTFTNTKDTP